VAKVENYPSGAKAHVDFATLTAVRAEALTYQPCLTLFDHPKSIFAACKAMPCYKACLPKSFSVIYRVRHFKEQPLALAGKPHGRSSPGAHRLSR
jgi:hypothetical protein